MHNILDRTNIGNRIHPYYEELTEQFDKMMDEFEKLKDETIQKHTRELNELNEEVVATLRRVFESYDVSFAAVKVEVQPWYNSRYVNDGYKLEWQNNSKINFRVDIRTDSYFIDHSCSSITLSEAYDNKINSTDARTFVMQYIRDIDKRSDYSVEDIVMGLIHYYQKNNPLDNLHISRKKVRASKISKII